MFDIFKREKQNKPPVIHEKKKKSVRSFIGARNTGMNKFNITFAKINQEIRTDGIALILRARSLYKNNETVNSFINLMLRSMLGNQGFILNVTSYNQDGNSDLIANETIENFWEEYTKSSKKYVSADEQMNGLDFDRHVIFNYLIDGEVFIRKVKDKKSKFGIRFEVIDALDVDMLKNNLLVNNNERIVTGIRIDEHNKPLSYFIRKNHTDYYQAGQCVEVDASQIIHIYKKYYAGQVRGFTPLSAVILSLNSLQEYKRQQINSSILNACYMGIYEKVSNDANSYQDYDQEEIDENGDVATVLESGVFKYAPDGYKLTNIANNHPNSGVKDFFKTMLKGICGCLGMSYNKISSDVSETSYSSLRQANIEDAVTVKELQQFFIDNWKNIQYEQFLKYLLISDLTNLPYSKIEKFMEHDFQGRNFQYLDPAKQMQAIQLRLSLGLSNPIIELKNQGLDVYDVLDGWKKFNDMLKDRGLKLSETLPMINTEEKIIEEE